MEFPVIVEEFMEQYKIVDSDHVYTNGSELVPIFRMRQWFEHLDSAIKTNADRIRSMTNEELAEFVENPNGKPWYRCGECKWESCKECCLEWLKQEAKDDL